MQNDPLSIIKKQVEAAPSIKEQPMSTSPSVDIVRLTEESLLFTKAMGGALIDLPPHHIARLERVLDINSGPGDWALAVAQQYIHLESVGIDSKEHMTMYANARRKTRRLSNLFFETMNWAQGFDYPDNSFDYINGRLLVLFLPRQSWPFVLQEIFRLLKPGGVLRLIDCDHLLCSSYAVDTFHHWDLQLFQKWGLGFSETGRTLGMSPVLPHLVRKAGFVDVTSKNYSIDFSAGSDDWNALYRNIEMAGTALMPEVIRAGITTQEEYDKVFQQMHIDMMSDNLYGLWPFFSVSGMKPA